MTDLGKKMADTMGPNRTQHTPGPWHATGAWIRRSDGGLIAAASDSYFMDEHGEPILVEASEQDANARLIAAAPELLAAAKLLLQHHRVVKLLQSDTAAPRVHALRAAIAIAEGGTS